MKLTAMPVLNPPYSLLEYGESEVGEYVHEFSQLLPSLQQLGVRENEVPDDFLEMHVFLNFMYGAMGEYTATGSLSCADWRKMQLVARMARKIGAKGLADQLDDAWQEMLEIPPEILDAYDRNMLRWDHPAPPADTSVSADQPHFMYVSKEIGAQVDHLLQVKWITGEIDNLAMDPPVSAINSYDHKLTIAAGRYLSNAPLEFRIYKTHQSLSAGIAKFLEPCDDYEVRLADHRNGKPFEEVWDNLRKAGDKVQLKGYTTVTHVSPATSIQSNSGHVAEDGFLLSEVPVGYDSLLVAYYKDMVQIVDPHTFAELAVAPLPEPFASRAQAKKRLTYAQALPWKLGHEFRPVSSTN